MVGAWGRRRRPRHCLPCRENPPTRGLPSHPEGGCAAAGMIRGVEAAQAGHHWSPYAAAAAAASSSGGGPRGPLAGVCRWGWTQSHGKREITWKGFPKLYVIHQSSTAGTAHSPEGDRLSCESFHSCCSLFSSSLIPTLRSRESEFSMCGLVWKIACTTSRSLPHQLHHTPSATQKPAARPE